MNKELQNKAWNCFPKEFKKEVKRMYKTCAEAESIGQFIKLFGYDNLTSDAEGEEDEMLFVKAKTVREMYALNEDILFLDPSHKGARLLKAKLQDLFGSKCLPDELNEDNFAKSEPRNCRFFVDGKCKHPVVCAGCDTSGSEDTEYKPQSEPKLKRCEKVITPSGEVRIIEDTHFENGCWLYLVGDPAQWISESDLEPYTELKENQNPSNSTELKPQDVDKQFDNILKDSFSKERRLNIATTITGYIIKSGYYSLSEKYQEDNINEMVNVSLQITDAIMAECEKGGDNENN